MTNVLCNYTDSAVNVDLKKTQVSTLNYFIVIFVTWKGNGIYQTPTSRDKLFARPQIQVNEIKFVCFVLRI